MKNRARKKSLIQHGVMVTVRVRFKVTLSIMVRVRGIGVNIAGDL